MNIALFASGSGSNVRAILENIQKDNLAINPICLVCDVPGAGVIDIAESFDLPVYVQPSKGQLRADWEADVLDYLSQFDIDYIVLAGFMRLLSVNFVDHYQGQILNIHPSLLPKYPGINSIERAYEDGEKETGVSIFYVDAGVDTGQMIAQEVFLIDSNWTLEDLEAEVHKLEHKMYTDVLIKLMDSEREDTDDKG